MSLHASTRQVDQHRYHLRVTAIAVLLLLVSTSYPSFAGGDGSPNRTSAHGWNLVYNASVEGTIIDGTWDPEDAMTVSGTLMQLDGLLGHCDTNGYPLAYMESLIVYVVPAEDNETNPGHTSCVALSQSPGTDAYGNFSFTLEGGGVSWLDGDGITSRGAYFVLRFKDPTQSDGFVSCGNNATYGVLPGCADAPEIYGELASPDLNGDGYVDSADLPTFAYFLDNDSWQADFNKTGTVDSGDVSYISGRLGASCGSSKAGPGYQMDAGNLTDPQLLDFLSGLDMTRAMVIADWQAMGLAYDTDFAATMIAEDSAVPESWTNIKRSYR